MRAKPGSTAGPQLLSWTISLILATLLGCHRDSPPNHEQQENAELTFAEQAAGVRAGMSNQIRLDHTTVTDRDLEPLDGLQDKLTRINFSRGEITDSGLARIGRMTGLEQLRLSSPRISDAGLEKLKDLKHLRFLHLIDMPIGDTGLDHLHGLTDLESVYLDGTRATDAGIGRLLKALPGVHLHIDDRHHPLDPHATDHTH